MKIDQVKQQILRLYRGVNYRDLDGMTIEGGAYVTRDRQWVYFVRHGGLIERTKFADAVSHGFSVEDHDAFMSDIDVVV